MAASPIATNGHDNAPSNDKWKKEEPEDVAMPPAIGSDGVNSARLGDRPTAPGDVHPDAPMSAASFESGGKPDIVHRGEKQIKVLVWSSFVPAVHVQPLSPLVSTPIIA